MDDLISRKKLLKDLAGMLDVCTGAGDPFLAAMIRKAMECVERQPAAPLLDGIAPSNKDEFWKAIIALEREWISAKSKLHVRNPVAYALYHIWKKADAGKL